MINLVDSALDFWLTAGRFERKFTQKLAGFLGAKHVIITNSGSSANLLAIAALTSPKLGARRLKPGDEVLTVAAGFPTTVAPIVQHGLVPVFVDIELGSYNVNVKQLEAAISEKTKAIFLAHTLGVPFDLDQVMTIVRRHNLWLIEDNCDALGARYALPHSTSQPLNLSTSQPLTPSPSQLLALAPLHRHLRPPGHPQLLPGPPYHYGRRRRGDHQ